MAEPLSQERFNAFGSSVLNQYDDLIPETDSSDMDDSQPFVAVLSNEDEVTISETSCESDDESESDRIQSSENDDDIIEETDASESHSSQSEFGAAADDDDEINIPATPSEDSEDEEDFSDHIRSNENDSPGTMNYSLVNSPLINSNEISIPHSNLSETNLSPILPDDENVISESDSGSQRSLNQFAIDTEISIPETPSQSESEQDQIEPHQSQEINTSQMSLNSQHSNQNAPAAFSIAVSQLEDDVVSVVANTVESNDVLRSQRISPDIFEDSDDIVPNSENIAVSYAGHHHTPLAIISPDIFDEDPVNEPMDSQNVNEVSPPVSPDVVHNDFPFIVPGN